MRHYAAAILLATLAGATPSNAFEFRCRWVERVGNVDVPIENDMLYAVDRGPHRVRLQLGVFDDANGPAPAGGLLGWSAGTLTVGSGAGDTVYNRTPGRLMPFNFSDDPNANGNPPLPGGDPFRSLTEIDATLGPQTLPWLCGPDGEPLSQPPPIVRGFNRYVSVFEFTVDPSANAFNHLIVAAGSVLDITEWRPVGPPMLPDCGDPANPNDDVPGSITYAPLPSSQQPFECSLLVYVIPGPGATALLALGGLLGARRGRRR